MGPGSLLRFVIGFVIRCICEAVQEFVIGVREAALARTFLSREGVPVLTTEKKRNAQVTTEKMNWKARGGTGTHLSEQRRCSSAHIPLAAQVVTKLWYQHFVSYASVTQQAEKRYCRRRPCDHLNRVQDEGTI